MAIRLSRFLKETWLRKEDIASTPTREIRSTITRVYTKRIAGEERLIVAFDKVERHLPLNQTNLRTLIDAIGGDDDAAAFVGLKVELYVDESVEYDGEIVGGIRLEAQEKVRPAVVK